MTHGRSRISLSRVLGRASVLLLVMVLGIGINLPRPVHAVTLATSCSASPDFELSVVPASLLLAAGASGSAMIVLTPLDGFTGVVGLSITNVDPILGTPVLGSSSLDLSSGAKTTMLTFTVSSAATAGSSYSLDVNSAALPTLSHTQTVTVHVPSPEIGIVSDSFFVSVPAGTSAMDGITLTALYGLSDTAVVTVFASPLSPPPPSAVAPTFTPPSPITLVSGSGTGSLAIDATVATPGYYGEKVSAAFSPAITNSTDLIVVVTGPGIGFTVPTHMIVPPGTSKDAAITVRSIDGFDGSSGVMLSAIAAAPPGDLTTMLTPSTVTFGVGSSAPSTLTVTASALIPPSTYGVILTARSGSIINSTFVEVIVPGPGFSIATSPDSLALTAGGSPMTSTISLGSELGFADTVNLSIGCFPDGLAASISPASLTLTASGVISTATLSISAYSFTSPGMYTVDVHGAAASSLAVNDTLVTVTVTPLSDFTITASTTTESIVSGGSTSLSIMMVTSVSGFVGTVDLTAIVSSTSYGLSTGLTASLSPSSVTLASGESKSVTLALTAHSAGTFDVTVYGSSGDTVHHTLIVVTVTSAGPGDFGASLSTSSLSIKQGNSDTSTITISPTSGFTGDVTLSVSVDRPGPTATLSKTTISGGSGSATVTVNVPSSVAAETYTVTVEAKGPGGSPSHSKDLTVTVASASPQPTAPAPKILGLDPTIFYSLIGGIAIVIVAGALVALRMRRPRSATSTSV